MTVDEIMARLRSLGGESVRRLGARSGAARWTMNACLAAIGIHSSEHRERAVGIGEKLGIFRDYPTSKGCTSPFAPTWIAEMVRRRQG